MSNTKLTNRKLEVVDPVTDAQQQALDIANTFREKIGEPRITGIVPGERSSSTNCILARTFNANCTVGYDDAETGEYDEESGAELRRAEFGWAAFFDRETAEAFRDAVNEHRKPEDEESAVLESADGARGFKVSIPTAVAQIAVDFDLTQLEKEMYEHNYPQLSMSKSINDILGLTATA